MQIKYKGVTADYQLGPIRTPRVIDSVNLVIPSGSYTAVIGHTGSGKSSLLKTMNGLLLPNSGNIEVGNMNIQSSNNKKILKAIRKKIGMVFQFPESQLFAETVEKDICFGPLNFGVPIEEAQAMAHQIIELVGLDKSVLAKSPFSLSGGQKRRVAIAGILAMQPEVLVLDEPGAGLDPKGRKEILDLIHSWHQEKGLTTILVTHDMEDVVQYADEVIVMERGKIALHDKVRTVFEDTPTLKRLQIELPEARKWQLTIEEKTGIDLPKVCLTLDELADSLIKVGLA